MKKIQAFKFRLKTNSHSESFFRSQCGACRFVWNKALALEKETYTESKKHIGYVNLSKELTKWKQEPELSFLSSTFSQGLQSTLKDLDRAYGNFFRAISKKKNGIKSRSNVQPPRFKKKGIHDSFRLPDPKTFAVDHENGRVRIPKLGWISYIQSRDIEGIIKNATVSRSGEHWYISIQTEQEVLAPFHSRAFNRETGEYIPTQSAIGIDLGIAEFATLSNGETFNYPKSSPLLRFTRKLRQAQKSLSRKKKGSMNRTKARMKIFRIHEKIRNVRSDFLHKVSYAVSKNHAFVAIEDLATGNMSRSASGTIETPGKSVKAKSGLNKSILDQGWREFRTMLEYKTQREGGILIAIKPQYTSQMCSNCGHTTEENRKNQAEFKCTNKECIHEENADFNASKNILSAGLVEYAKSIIACGENIRPEKKRVSNLSHILAVSVKQEPTMSTQELQATGF